MASSINNLSTNMQQISANSDGTINGGFVSITGGRYRMIIGGPGGQAFAANEKRCNHQACENRVDCSGSTNDFDCTNYATCLAVSINPGTISSVTQTF
jgi:hypothetical protein